MMGIATNRITHNVVETALMMMLAFPNFFLFTLSRLAIPCRVMYKISHVTSPCTLSYNYITRSIRIYYCILCNAVYNYAWTTEWLIKGEKV